MKNDPVQAAIARLGLLDPATAEGRKEFVKALASKWNFVAAKAARIAGESLARGLAVDLVNAFGRFLEKGAALDKGCVASLAIARALIALDHDDPEIFRRGVKHIQMEGTWGKSEDTAAELRAVCAMGLANTRDRNKMRDLVELMVDKEWIARAGAIKAIGAVGSEAASLLLRLKVHLGDEEPDVMTDCLIGLIDVDGAEALPFVEGLMDSEPAILALGASRRADAIAILLRRFSATPDPEVRSTILLALAGSRTEAAISFLLDLIAQGSAHEAKQAADAMSTQGLRIKL